MNAPGDAIPLLPQGTCFGLEVRSTLPFTFLRTGAGRPLEVLTPSSPVVTPTAQLVQDWPARPGRSLHVRLYQDGDRFGLWYETDEWFEIEPAVPRVMVPETDDPVRGEGMLWGIPASVVLAYLGYLPVHAAAVEVDGGAVLLAAPGGFGKTTLAAAFHTAGYRLLTEDIACISEESELSIIPGPAILRVRPDVMERLDLDAAEVVGRSPTRITLAIDLSRRGDCSPVPVRAVVFLRAGPSLTVQRIRSSDAIPDLWALSRRYPGFSGAARGFQQVAHVASRIPMWNVHRPLTLEALPEVVATIAALRDRAA